MFFFCDIAHVQRKICIHKARYLEVTEARSPIQRKCMTHSRDVRGKRSIERHVFICARKWRGFRYESFRWRRSGFFTFSKPLNGFIIFFFFTFCCRREALQYGRTSYILKYIIHKHRSSQRIHFTHSWPCTILFIYVWKHSSCTM